MSVFRFFVGPEQMRGQHVTFRGEQARQIFSVLRMREAQRILVLDNSGWQYDVLLDKVSSDHVSGTITGRAAVKGEPATELTLFQAMLKKDNFEWVLQKGTEVGVSRFVPMISERCVVRQENLKPVKEKRWRRIVVEAAEQSGRGYLPQLAEPLMFEEVLARAGEFDGVFVPWTGERERGLSAAIQEMVAAHPAGKPRIAILIGPEGGFSDGEIEDAQKAGLLPVTLGPRILRAETAAVVASTLALSALGEL